MVNTSVNGTCHSNHFEDLVAMLKPNDFVS